MVNLQLQHRAFRAHYKLGWHDAVPDRKSVQLWVANFRATGSALKRKPPGRPRSARTPDSVQAVRLSVTQSPTRSARKHASALGLSDRTVRRILHTDMQFHPYKLMIAQKLHESDLEDSMSCCTDVLQNVPVNDVLLTTDEAHFHLSGCVNKQNFRYWAENNPRHERPLPSERVTAWCAVSTLGV
ncbi:uncharacterized protein LOC143024401 [Oratosquilla oratoria]|uniref:uncharacterized protein LOC143024401 n=1 Tax=Oratosquilla oratoria TaxID=337810 RepID=UPI003F757B4B